MDPYAPNFQATANLTQPMLSSFPEKQEGQFIPNPEQNTYAPSAQPQNIPTNQGYYPPNQAGQYMQPGMQPGMQFGMQPGLQPQYIQVQPGMQPQYVQVQPQIIQVQPVPQIQYVQPIQLINPSPPKNNVVLVEFAEKDPFQNGCYPCYKIFMGFFIFCAAIGCFAALSMMSFFPIAAGSIILQVVYLVTLMKQQWDSMRDQNHEKAKKVSLYAKIYLLYYIVVVVILSAASSSYIERASVTGSTPGFFFAGIVFAVGSHHVEKELERRNRYKNGVLNSIQVTM